MAEILGLGVSHYPPLSGLDKDMANAHRGRLNDPDIPATAKDPNTWSELAQREWADPVAGAASHRAAMRTGMSRVRQALDDFDPDFARPSQGSQVSCHEIAISRVRHRLAW
jgi:hypothetical protein